MIDPKNLSGVGGKLFELIEFDQDEELVYEIRKHPFGLFLIYFTGIFITVAILVAAMVGGHMLETDSLGTGVDTGRFSPWLIALGFIMAAASVLLTLIGGYIYRSNVVLVTSEKIAQVLYKNIISRKISQLSIGDIQDVTVRQDGLIARLLNYGTLVIETAGEQQNYTFNYTPSPYEAAKAMVGAHERDVAKHGN